MYSTGRQPKIMYIKTQLIQQFKVLQKGIMEQSLPMGKREPEKLSPWRVLGLKNYKELFLEHLIIFLTQSEEPPKNNF